MTSAPARRRSPARAKKPSAGARLFSLATGHPREVLAALFLTGCGGFIAWNALVLQNARHPAPLFTPQAGQRPAPEAVRPVPPTRPLAAQSEQEAVAPIQPMASVANPTPAAPAPASKLPSRGAISDMIRNGGEVAQPAPPQARVAPVAPTAPAPAPSRAPTVRDPIGEIIRMGGPVPTPPANVGQADSGGLVLSGQKALAKLGYGIRADGVMGAGTRQAIERFEQDRRLPVTGEFGPRTARELSSLSGIAVQ